MGRKLGRRSLLAGASLLAIVMGASGAGAAIFGSGDFVVPTTGYYEFKVAGASGGGVGGLGAIVGGELFLDGGNSLHIVAGGVGQDGICCYNDYGSGGGGGSFVFLDGHLEFAAGGGGGQPYDGFAGPGIGHGGYPGGYASYGGGGGGSPSYRPPPWLPPGQPAEPGSFPNGGAGASYNGEPYGGYGGGGGGGYSLGGGGGGAPGGGANYGGYSYVTKTAFNPFGITGVNSGNGYISISPLAVPEPSTWAMMLAGFSALGLQAWRRARKIEPA